MCKKIIETVRAYTREYINPGCGGITRKCRQVAFVNITYYEKPTLCLRVSIAQGK